MLPTITPEKIDLPAGTILKFSGTVADYEEVLKRLGNRSIPRLRFRDNHILLFLNMLIALGKLVHRLL